MQAPRLAAGARLSYSQGMQSRDALAKLARALGGIPVWGSLPGSPAHRLGVRYGDIVLSVNGMKTSTIEEYFRARSGPDGPLEVVLFRDGRELTLRFDSDGSDEPSTPPLESVAEEVVAARLLATEPPPPSSSGDTN